MVIRIFFSFLILCIDNQLTSNKTFFIYSSFLNQSSRRKDVSHDLEYESDTDNRHACPSRKPSQEISSTAMLPNKNNSPIHPHQDLVKCIEKLQTDTHDDATTKNGHYELINIGKIPSESSLKLNSTLPSKNSHKITAQWHPNCDKTNDLKPPTQTSSMNNINNNNDKGIGNQQLGASNFCVIRTRTQTKSLSTRISSLKRESKTTRTLSIGKTQFPVGYFSSFT